MQGAVRAVLGDVLDDGLERRPHRPAHVDHEAVEVVASEVIPEHELADAAQPVDAERSLHTHGLRLLLSRRHHVIPRAEPPVASGGRSPAAGSPLDEAATAGRRSSRRRQGIIEVIVRTSPVPFDSDALRANIASTAQKVVIPDRYLPLVDAVEGLHGVRALPRRDPGRVLPHLPQRRPSSSRASRPRSSATGPTSSAPRTAPSSSGSVRSWCSGCSTPSSRTSSTRCSCAGSSCGARTSWTGSTATTTTTSLRRSASRWPGCCPCSRRVPRARRAAARPGRAGRRATGAEPRLPRALSPRAPRRLSPGAGAPRRPGVGDGAGCRPHRRCRRRRALRLPREAAVATLRHAAEASPGEALLSPDVPGALRHPRARDRPALPGRESRGPLRRVPLLPEGRHARLSPERGHGRPAGRRQADAWTRTGTWTSRASSPGSPPSSATATTSSCSCASSATRPSAWPSARPATSRPPTT